MVHSVRGSEKVCGFRMFGFGVLGARVLCIGVRREPDLPTEFKEVAATVLRFLFQPQASVEGSGP